MKKKGEKIVKGFSPTKKTLGFSVYDISVSIYV